MALVVVNSSWGIPPHCQKVSRVLNVVISCTFETFMFCYWFSSSAPQKASRPSRWHLTLGQSIRIYLWRVNVLCSCHKRDKGGSWKHVKLCILQTWTETQEGLCKSSKSQGEFTQPPFQWLVAVVWLYFLGVRRGAVMTSTTQLLYLMKQGIVGSSCQIHSSTTRVVICKHTFRMPHFSQQVCKVLLMEWQLTSTKWRDCWLQVYFASVQPNSVPSIGCRFVLFNWVPLD